MVILSNSWRWDESNFRNPGVWGKNPHLYKYSTIQLGLKCVFKILYLFIIICNAKKPAFNCFQISSSTQYFWYRNTLEISDDVNNPDNFNWPIAACLLAAWCLVYLCIVKGITENPKIIYVTAIYPYVVLIIFFFRGITLEGMEDGIRHLFKPKVYKFLFQCYRLILIRHYRSYFTKYNFFWCIISLKNWRTLLCG